MPFFDVRLVIRQLRRSPGLSVIAVVALAIGIGLTTAMFSIVNGALLRGLPFEKPDQLMHIVSLRTSTGDVYVARLHDIVDWRERQTTFQGIAAWTIRPLTLSAGGGGAERYSGGLVSSDLFDLLRVRPVLGRGFEREDELDGAAPVVVLSHDLWRGRFEGDPGIVGRVLRIEGESRTVIGVMPEGFSFPIREDLWIPVNTLELPAARTEGGRFFALGRLKDGVTEAEAEAELGTIGQRLAEEFPETNRELGILIGPYLHEIIGERLVSLTYAMLVAVFGVLLIACANVANLLLARTALRTKEVAVRLGMGASRARILLSLLAESFVLATLGAVLGLVIAKARIDQFNVAVQSAPTVPFWFHVSLDGSALTFVLLVTFVATLVAGCLPAYQASRTALGEILKSESRAASSLRLGRLSRTLVVAEIALSCGLLVAAGLMIKTVTRLSEKDYGFDAGNVLIARVELNAWDYPDVSDQRRFFSELRERIAAKPGAQAVALTSYFPDLGAGGSGFALDGAAAEDGSEFPVARFAAVTPEFFDVFDAWLREGRRFTLADDASGPPVAIVNQSFATRYFEGTSPVGRRIRFARRDDSPWMTIVGVAPDLSMNRRRPASGMLEEDGAGFFVPFAQHPQRAMGIAVRSASDPLVLAPALRESLDSINREQLLYDVSSLAQSVANENVYYGLISEAFLVFGASALLLASIGLYGVLSFSVNRRTREIGVRLAMGANASDIVRMVLRQGGIQLATGVAFGLGLSFALTRALEIALFGVEPYDPGVFAAVVLVLAATGLVATAVPARRAAFVDPVASLRDE